MTQIEYTAAPVIRKPKREIGAPGMTDFVRIYIASELSQRECRTTLRHEQAHVWAGHNRRRPKDAKHDTWAIACEMEIARNIYDTQDLANITEVRSRLAGGYLPDTIDGLPPEITLAEGIYEWLLANPDKQPQIQSLCACTCACDDDGAAGAAGAADAEGVAGSGESIVLSVREKLDADEASVAAQAAAAAAYTELKHRPPTLTSAIDAALRARLERERSYRRPSRRNEPQDLLLAGAISVPRPPLVEIFIDRSGSFTPTKTAAAEQQLTSLLSRYGATIRSDVWYFANGALTAHDRKGGGDTPYGLICAHLTASKPKLAIIITDDDHVGSSVTPLNKLRVLCVPIGCTHTKLAAAIGGTDVVAA